MMPESRSLSHSTSMYSVGFRRDDTVCRVASDEVELEREVVRGKSSAKVRLETLLIV